MFALLPPSFSFTLNLLLLCFAYRGYPFADGALHPPGFYGTAFLLRLPHYLLDVKSEGELAWFVLVLGMLLVGGAFVV